MRIESSFHDVTCKQTAISSYYRLLANENFYIAQRLAGSAHMETKRLRFFVEIANHGSINRAATSLGMAQPALSQQLAVLESELKAKLFVRSSRGVTPTEAGHRLYSRANTILRQLDLLDSDLGEAPQSISGMVCIGMPPTLITGLGLGLVSHAMTHYPKLKLQMVEESANELIGRLQSGLIDMAVLPSDCSIKDVDVTPLMKEQVFLASGAATPTTAQAPAELAQLPWVTTQFPNQLRGAIANWFALHGLEPRIVAELNSLRIVLGLVADGKAVTMLPKSAIFNTKFEEHIRLVPLDPPVSRTAYVAVRRERESSAVIGAIDEALRMLARRLPSAHVFPAAKQRQ